MKKWYSWKAKKLTGPNIHQLMNGYINGDTPHNLAIRGNELLIFAIIWMNIENIMLGEISQSQKTTHCMIPFI